MANEILSVEGQLVGIPLQEYTAGPGIVVDNVDKVIKVADDFIVTEVLTFTKSVAANTWFNQIFTPTKAGYVAIAMTPAVNTVVSTLYCNNCVDILLGENPRCQISVKNTATSAVSVTLNCAVTWMKVGG